jgi:hypothetical protein
MNTCLALIAAAVLSQSEQPSLNSSGANVGVGHWTARTNGALSIQGGGASFFASVGGGTFVTENILIGGDLGFSVLGFGNTTVFSPSLGLTGDYWHKFNPRFFGFAGLAMAIVPRFAGTSNVDFTFGPRLGVAFFVVPWLAIQPMMSFNFTTPGAPLGFEFLTSWSMAWYF